MVETTQLPEDSIRISAELARRLASDLFNAVGVPPTDSDLVAEVLVSADLRGIRSHGLARLPYFLVRLENRVIATDPEMRFEQGSPTTGVLDAANGIGIVAADRAMTQAMRMALENGSGFVAVRDSSHFGYAGFWAEKAMRAGMLGISMSNSGRRVAPTFGVDSVLGTNPLSVTLPGSPGETDFYLDMATSAVAVGKVETALRVRPRLSPMTMERMDLFRSLAAHRDDEIVIMTMTATLQWPLVSQHPLDFDFLAFGMGHASDFGLGLALARPERKTIVLKGDGGLLMGLGSLVTLGRYGPPNLLVLLLENRSYEMTGGQPLAPGVDFAKMAKGAGVAKVETIDTLEEFETALPRLLSEPGPHFVVLPVTNSQPLPPVSHTDHTGRVTNLRRALGVPAI